MDNFLGYTSLQAGMGQQGLQNVNTSHTAQQISSEVILQELQAGDTFQGEIMSVNGQEVQLQLANGLYMAARLEGEVQLALGQLLNFQVQSNQNSKIVLKPIYTNLLQQRVGESALKAANLVVNDKNLQMVSKLIENGMSIDKNSLALFNRHLLQHPQVNVDSLIRLHQLGVKITDANLTQLEHYQNMEHKLFEGIQETVDDISRLYESISGKNTDAAITAGQNGNVQSAGSFMEQILGFLSEKNGMPLGENAFRINLAVDERQEGTVIAKENMQNPDMAANELQGKFALNENGAVQQGNILNTDNSSKLFEVIKQLQGVPEEQLTDKLQGLLKAGSLDVDTLKELLFSGQGIVTKLSVESKDKLYRSEEFRELLKDTLQKEWSLAPEELTEDGKIKEFYQKLMQQSEKMSQIMEQAASQNQTNAGNALQNIRENVEFMNQMNQLFQYVQLPLKLSGSQAQGELYVYTNKRNLAKKDGMLTAILHLDMEHLGNMDINISLNMDTDQVINKFYVEEDTVALLEEHMEELVERLVKKGYHSQTTFEKRISEKTVFEQIEEQAGGMSAPLAYQNFDIRT